MNKVIFLDVDGVLNNGTWAIDMFDKGIRVYHDDLLYLVKGQYKTITGIVLKVDQTEQHITIRSGADTEVIPFSDIYRIFKPTG